MMAATSVRTSISKVSDDGMNNGLPGETKRLGKWWMVVGGVITIVGTVIIDAVKKLL